MIPSFQEENKLRKAGYKKVAGIDEVGRGCERPDAELLTNNGWKFYMDINSEKDKVLSYTKEGFIEWQKVEKIIEREFEGNLIQLNNKGINIVVTPDHYFTVIRRVFKRDKKDSNRLKLVGYKTRPERKLVTDLLANDVIPRGGNWKGINKRNFYLPGINRQEDKKIDIKLWLAFFGLFISEGSTSYYKKKGMYRVTISQNKNSSPDKYKKISRLLKKLPFIFNAHKIGFTCCNKQLFIYLKQFGKRYDKFIPNEIKESSPNLLNVLIEWMILGDGTCYKSKNRKKVCVYYTVSKKLRDDFEEVLLKAGWTYHTHIRPLRDRYFYGRLIKKENQKPCFEIRLRKNNKSQVKFLHKHNVFYKGKVFCLQLSLHHNFFIRRHGTGYFTGNSLSGPVVACAVAINGQKPKIKNVRDSKQLSARQREMIYRELTQDPRVEWGIGLVSEKVIDKINILEATKLAMQKAIQKLVRPNFLILDGNFSIKSSIPQKSIIKADEKVFSCSCASIIAKVTRDKLMLKYDQKYPYYGLASNKGYPTKYHREMIKKYGSCKIHRKSFGPVFALDKRVK